MNLSSNTILVTGGTSGIGLALAAKLAALPQSDPQLKAYACDVSVESERVRLFEEVTRDYPALNVLFNNAGIQYFPALNSTKGWDSVKTEVATNLLAPIHLAMLFAGHLAAKTEAAILNTTSGLAHVPLAVAPVYSATKAALHSFTMSLRYQLRNTAIKVIEVSPPHVATDLGAPGANASGMNLDAYADTVIAGLRAGDLEVTTGFSTLAAQGTRAERDEFFRQMNARITQGKDVAPVKAP